MEEVSVSIRSDKLDRVGTGRYSYGRYSVAGRLMYGAKSSLPFILLSMLLLLIPGESFFYALFFFVFVPYQTVALIRLKKISFAIDGPCPACAKVAHFPLEPSEHLPLWKYCPHCNDPLHIS